MRCWDKKNRIEEERYSFSLLSSQKLATGLLTEWVISECFPIDHGRVQLARKSAAGFHTKSRRQWCKCCTGEWPCTATGTAGDGAFPRSFPEVTHFRNGHFYRHFHSIRLCKYTRFWVKCSPAWVIRTCKSAFTSETTESMCCSRSQHISQHFSNWRSIFSGAMHGPFGDYVWGENGMDRIVTQLLNQMDGSSRPVGLTDQQINKLPIIKVGLDF